jgi:phosphomethylpyrimidine synthase
MKITKDVRKLVSEQQIPEEQAFQGGMTQKAKEFAEKGAEVYVKA